MDLTAGSTGIGPGADVAHHPAVEEYLQTVYHLQESGVPAIRTRLVERLRVSPPAVSEQVRRLEREGFVRLGAGRTVELTPAGHAYATTIVRRHRLAERLLVDVLGLPWHQVHAEAGRLEHAISPVLEARLVAVLGDPATCPHGNPIPGSMRAVALPPLIGLHRLRPGVAARVARIEEELQADHGVLVQLERAGLLPGAPVSIENDAEPTGPPTVTARGSGGVVRLAEVHAQAVLAYLT